MQNEHSENAASSGTFKTAVNLLIARWYVLEEWFRNHETVFPCDVEWEAEDLAGRRVFCRLKLTRQRDWVIQGGVLVVVNDLVIADTSGNIDNEIMKRVTETSLNDQRVLAAGVPRLVKAFEATTVDRTQEVWETIDTFDEAISSVGLSAHFAREKKEDA